VGDFLKVRVTRRGQVRGRWRAGHRAGSFIMGMATSKTLDELSLMDRLLMRVADHKAPSSHKTPDA
jgi:hypothetical protein